jgi:hypothetical protein
MSTLIAYIGLIWLSLIYIVPKITRGNVAVSDHSITAVPSALLASMTLLMVTSGLAILFLTGLALSGTPVNLHIAVEEPSQYLLGELICNASVITVSLLVSNALAPSLFHVKSGFWAAVASLPMAALLTIVGFLHLASTIAE